MCLLDFRGICFDLMSKNLLNNRTLLQWDSAILFENNLMKLNQIRDL